MPEQAQEIESLLRPQRAVIGEGRDARARSDEIRAAFVGNLDASNFKGHGVGVVPALTFAVPIGEKPVSFTAKALFDVDSEKRFDGNLFMASTAFAF